MTRGEAVGPLLQRGVGACRAAEKRVSGALAHVKTQEHRQKPLHSGPRTPQRNPKPPSFHLTRGDSAMNAMNREDGEKQPELLLCKQFFGKRACRFGNLMTRGAVEVIEVRDVGRGQAGGNAMHGLSVGTHCTSAPTATESPTVTLQSHKGLHDASIL